MPVSNRVTATVLAAPLFGVLAACLIGVVGIVGVDSAAGAGERLARDEIATAVVTARFAHAVDSASADGQELIAASDDGRRAAVVAELSNRLLPDADSAAGAVERAHAGDSAVERADIADLVSQWATMRRVLTGVVTAAPGPTSLSSASLEQASEPVRTHLQALIAREDSDAQAGGTRAARAGHRDVVVIVTCMVLASIALIVLALSGLRRLRRMMEPAQDQIEFADTLQLATDEDEAHHLLQRYLERLLPGTSATVLNRNNSADRLQAVTEVAGDSVLSRTLVHAQPRSCLAVRSGRPHTEDDHRTSLLACPVCAECPGASICAPLTVSGEVIGSVLVNRSTEYSTADEQQLRDSVAQAAPVLANLRNLAIAEIRAATDALTGLPNKRATADSLKRLVAQASRSRSPLSVLMFDLDHFKDVNDRFGHPVGDQALAAVGAAIRSALRESDLGGRNGGEEFVVLLPSTDIDGALHVADKIRAAIADIRIPGQELTLTASVGIAALPAHATTSDRIERLADAALYTAKRGGRNRVEVAQPTDVTTQNQSLGAQADEPLPQERVHGGNGTNGLVGRVGLEPTPGGRVADLDN